MKNKTHVALLRGINVGGNKKIPMTELKGLFEKIGFTEIKTILASGNIVFQSEENNFKSKIQVAIKNHFGFEVATQVIPLQEIEKMIKSEPFKNSPKEKKLKHYVSFIKNKSPIFNTINLEEKGTIDLMSEIEKQHGKENVTTRTWKTIERIMNSQK